MAKGSSRHRARLRVWHLVLIVAAVVAIYANSLPNPFLLDDLDTVANNSHIRRAGTMFETERGSALTGRPAVAVTFAANYAIGGTDPGAWRAVNLAIHALCALLVYGIVRRTVAGLGDSRPVWLRDADSTALVVALLWAVHPLGSEVVNYVTQRTESLMALFFLLTLYASIRGNFAVAVAACAIGMLCKEPMATAPLIVLLYDRAFRFVSFREAFRARGRLYLALAATWIILGIIVATQTREFSGGYASAAVSVWTYLLNQGIVIPHYLQLVVWPDKLVAFYGWATPITLADVWPQMLALAVLFLASIWMFVRSPRIGFLALAFFITLAPASSIIPIAAEVGADRRMYLPLVPLMALFVVGAARALAALVPARQAVLAGVALTVLVAVPLGARTITRNRDYASELVLSQTVLNNWGGAIGHHMVGLSHLKLARFDEAIVYLRQAADEYPNARYDLGTALFRVGQLDEAAVQLLRFITDEPNLFASSAARTLLGRAAAAQGRTAEAIQYLREATSGPAPDPSAHGPLADLFLDQKNYADAITHFRAYLDAFPSHAPAHTGLGIALASSGQNDDAVEAFERAYQLDSLNAQSRENLLNALMRSAEAHVAQGRFPRARAALDRALVVDPTFAPARQLLAKLPR